MNILVINLDKAIFSPGSKSLERLKEYSQLVDKIFVIVWTRNKEEPIVFENKLFIYPTNSASRLSYYFDTFKISRKILKEHKIDLIFTQDPFETGLAGWFIARKNRTRLQLQVHTDFLSPYFWRESLANKLRVRLGKFLIRRADGFRVVSERIKMSLIALGVVEEKIFVLPIFVDVGKIQASLPGASLKEKYPQFDFLILMASRLSREKNIGLAIEAMLDIIKKYPKAGLIVVGSGDEEESLKSKVRNLKLADSVVFEPRADDLASYYKSADLFLLASNYEGWGMSVPEAMAAGCPVLMTDVGCAGEVVVNNENGLVVPVNDRAAVCETIERIISEPALIQKFKESGLKIKDFLMTKEEYFAKYKNSWEFCLK
ncbi:MAG: glycosyltransferase family 4 protein [bacterium]